MEYKVITDGIRLRDHLAANEPSELEMGSIQNPAEFCGISPSTYEKLNPLERRAMCLARWRYMCADAMLRYMCADAMLEEEAIIRRRP